MAKKKVASKLTNASKRAKFGVVNQAEIKRRREKLGLSQSEAAALAGFKSAIQWWDIEKKPGRDPLVSTMVKVARALGCKVDQLLRKA